MFVGLLGVGLGGGEVTGGQSDDRNARVRWMWRAVVRPSVRASKPHGVIAEGKSLS